MGKASDSPPAISMESIKCHQQNHRSQEKELATALRDRGLSCGQSVWRTRIPAAVTLGLAGCILPALSRIDSLVLPWDLLPVHHTPSSHSLPFCAPPVPPVVSWARSSGQY